MARFLQEVKLMLTTKNNETVRVARSANESGAQFAARRNITGRATSLTTEEVAVKITRHDFAALLRSLGGAFPVTLTTRTEPKIKKTGNPNPEVVRFARSNGFVGGAYESIANNKLEREGDERDFEAKPLPWGRHAGRFFIEHKGKLYLKFFPISTLEQRWETPDGRQLSDAQVVPFLPPVSENRGGVAWRTVALENILEATVDGRHLVLVGNVDTLAVSA